MPTLINGKDVKLKKIIVIYNLYSLYIHFIFPYSFQPKFIKLNVVEITIMKI